MVSGSEPGTLPSTTLPNHYRNFFTKFLPLFLSHAAPP